MTLALNDAVAADTPLHGTISPGRWQLDRRVPIALILSIFVQTALLGVWLGRTEARLDMLEQFERDNRQTDARLAVIETRLDVMHQRLSEISHQLRIGNE